MELKEFFSENVGEGCDPKTIEEAQLKLGLTFPQWYIDYLLRFNGAEASYELNKLGYLKIPDGDDFALFPINQFFMLEKSMNYWEEFDLKKYDLFTFGACESNFMLCFDIYNYKIFLFEMDFFIKHYIALNFEKLKERIIASSETEKIATARYNLYSMAKKLINGSLPSPFFDLLMRWDWADKSAKYTNINGDHLLFTGLPLEKSNQLWTEKMKDLKFYPFGTSDQGNYFGFNVDEQKVYLLSPSHQIKLLDNTFIDFLANLRDKDWEVWQEW